MSTLPSIETTDCVLLATARTIADDLYLRYEITNISSGPLYLFNKFGKAGGSTVFDADPNTANVILYPDRVVVSKALVPVPDDKEVERQYVPMMTRVEAGQKFEEQVKLSLPLAPFTWYESRWLRSSPLPYPLFFELGYALASQRVESLVQSLKEISSLTYHADWFPLDLQKTIATGPLAEVLVLSAR